MMFYTKEECNHKIFSILGIKLKLKKKSKIKNLKQFAKIIGADLPKTVDLSIPFKRVLTQSPYATPGDFIISAKWYDSDKVIPESLEKGATAIFCSPEVKKRYPQENVFAIKAPTYAVQRFEEWWAKDCKAKRITITGSNGKTTTTGLINSIISNSFDTLTHNPMSNSHGAILRNIQGLKPSHKFWVQEVGGVMPGYIENTAKFLRPDIVVLTNIIDQHLDLYKTKENIFIDKTSLERYAKKDAKVIINYDDEMLRNAKYTHEVITYSIKDSKADYFAKDIRIENEGLYFTAVCRHKKEIKIHLNLLGDYNAYNALCAIAVGEWAGVELEKIPALLETYYPQEMRQHPIKVGGYSIFVDTFTADYETALNDGRTLSKLIVKNGGKKIFVFGHMDKYGDVSAEMHKKLGFELAKLNIDTILCYAGDAKSTYDGLKESGFENAIWFETRDELDNWLRNNITRNDEIFFKSGQFTACLTMTIDHVFGTSLQNALQYNNGYPVEKDNWKFHIRRDDIAEITGYKGKDKELIIPSNYEENISTRISHSAFARNNNIASVTIPDSVSVIGKYAFFRCFGLKNVNLPKNLLFIDKNAFNSCVKLEEVDIPKNVIHIDERAFYDCKSLRKAIIHENVGFIEKETFDNAHKDFVIICKEGSYAEEYAKENRIKFSYIK